MKQETESMKAKPLWSLEQLGQEEALDIKEKTAGSPSSREGTASLNPTPTPISQQEQPSHPLPSSKALIQVLENQGFQLNTDCFFPKCKCGFIIKAIIRTDKLRMAVYSLCGFQKKLKEENEKIKTTKAELPPIVYQPTLLVAMRLHWLVCSWSGLGLLNVKAKPSEGAIQGHPHRHIQPNLESASPLPNPWR